MNSTVHTECDYCTYTVIPNNITSNNSKVCKNLIQESLSFSLEKGDVVFLPYELFITIHHVS